jgi:acetyl-CoA carboxylase biotin carboxylase subunit
MFYDPLIGKVVVHTGSRYNTTGQMRRALEDLRIEGLKTNVPALLRVFRDERFLSGEYDTGVLGK